ncbi:MAG TPA: UDP-N-acetylenolpyruvoylglucosamine reductase [Flavobacteriales bacterium]|nr:UDP-N-acetylenolpyruvoylglucosamine reductase [Flavobacteriales bacterium]|tara:strand:+ start:87985 stop:89001 length:1017 start_codon:yes stop_codon:yes gene_type:complete
MHIETNASLKAYNTFGLNAKCKYLIKIHSTDSLQELIQSKLYKENPHLILGGGSNVLFTKDFNGIVIINELSGIEKTSENDETVNINAAAGENWHQFVLHCIENNWAGIENLSLIPGTVGAAPMQNIGAYGVEVKDVITKVNAINLETGEMEQFSNDECRFGYRTSIFKTSHKNKYFITSVDFTLSKKPHFNTSYGAIRQKLDEMGVKELSLKAVSDAVIAIRTEKLPNPEEIGNAGSFFKNPTVSQETFARLKKNFPDIPNYPQPDNKVKLAAGWLIEQCGWKGKTFDGYGVHKNQALVLVNYSLENGQPIYDLSEKIIESVQNKFGITLEREVNVY